MTIKSHISDPATGLNVSVVNEDEENGLVVATRPLKTYNNKPLYFLDSDGSKDMNVNVTYAGTPDKVHNGTDDVLWTASGIVGVARWVFDSTTQAHAGTKSIDGTGTVDNDIAQFAKGSSIDLSNYTTITGWIYLTGWSTNAHIKMYGWDTGTGLQVKDSINIDEYVNINLLNVWQKFAIPLSDFGLAVSTIDAFRIMTVKGVHNPNYYLDDIQVEETGTPAIFTIEPNKGTWLFIKSFDITIVDEYDATLVNNSMPKLPHSGFLGVSSLTSGLVAKRIQSGKVMFQTTFKDLIDFLGLPLAKIVGYGSDGTDTFVKISQKMVQPLILKNEDGDKFTYTVRDNLSGLKKFWISVGCYEEERPLTRTQ